MAQLSLAAQMRRKKAEGYSTGQVARLFGVSYHQAYQAVVRDAGARDTITGAKVEAGPEDLSTATDKALVALFNTEGNGKRFALIRRAAEDELEKRYPDGNYPE